MSENKQKVQDKILRETILCTFLFINSEFTYHHLINYFAHHDNSMQEEKYNYNKEIIIFLGDRSDKAYPIPMYSWMKFLLNGRKRESQA